MMKKSLAILALLSIPACATAPSANAVHEDLVAAINSNDVDRMLAMMTDDVVLLPPGAPPMVGKATLRPWLEGYVAAFETRWDKRVEELVVCGEWAFQRYSYSHVDKPRGGGEPVRGTGWGLMIYHLDDDGVWRVARDAWGSDQSDG